MQCTQVFALIREAGPGNHVSATSLPRHRCGTATVTAHLAGSPDARTACAIDIELTQVGSHNHSILLQHAFYASMRRHVRLRFLPVSAGRSQKSDCIFCGTDAL